MDYISEQNLEANSRNLELAHIIGLNAGINNCLQAHPALCETIVYCVGGIVITEDLAERNNQVFFRHGTNQVNCFRLSNSGRLLAVGFIADNLEKQVPVNIVIWDFENKKVLYELSGLIRGVKQVEFSPDDKFICALGLDNAVFIWESASGYKCYNRVFEINTNLIYWARIAYEPNSKYPNYSLAVSNINNLHHYYFYYDLKSLHYAMASTKFSLPSSGFARTFISAAYDYNLNQLFVGTYGGELCVFNLDRNIYKASYNVINHGLTGLVVLGDSSIIVGGGDGKIKKLLYENDKHLLAYEVQLDGAVNSMSLSADKKEVVVSTVVGLIYRVLVSDLTFALHSAAHHTSVHECSFGLENDKLYAVDDSGRLTLWELNDFTQLHSIPGICNERATAVRVADDNTIFVGYSTGMLRNYSQGLNSRNWELSTHRGRLNCIYVDGNYILTGGEDGIVRVWTRKTHDLVMQFSAHHKEVRSLFADKFMPNIVYSGGEDRNMNCFDLKLQKRVNVHHIKNGMIYAMDQKIGDQKEVLSVGHNCGLCIWDFFKNEPVGEIQLGKSFFSLKLSNSGRFFAIGSEDGEVWLFAVDNYGFLCKSSGHSRPVVSLKWSPDDKQIVSASLDASVCVWNVYLGN